MAKEGEWVVQVAGRLRCRRHGGGGSDSARCAPAAAATADARPPQSQRKKLLSPSFSPVAIGQPPL